MAKVLDAKLLGGIFLIMGTSIGGGMLALPVTNAGPGFVESTIFLFFCWLIMTVGALLILEVNLWFPSGSNLVSMAKNTLGQTGKYIAWFTYLFLLYALLCAYIAAGSDISYGLINLAGIPISQMLSTALFVGLFGILVYRGIKSVDMTTRGLIFAKIILFIILILLAAPHVSIINLQGGDRQYLMGAIMVLITSFGFATIVPSLRSYLNNDAKKLRMAIIIGSLIPLLSYITWSAIIIGVLPREGENGLIALLLGTEAPTTTMMAKSLQNVVDNNSLTQFFRIFSSVCILTSFLGVALAMTDFLADGLKLKKEGRSGLLIIALTFLPPVILVLFKPDIFIHALAYAGAICVILLLMLPVCMAWRGRYVLKLNNGQYQLMGGRITLVATGIIATGLIYLALI